MQSEQIIDVTNLDFKKLETINNEKATKIKFLCNTCKRETIANYSTFIKKDLNNLLCKSCTRLLKIDNIKKKTRETCLRKYGAVSNFVILNKERKAQGKLIGAADPKIREKMAQTNKARYGVESCSPFSRKDVQEKTKQTLKEKYGVDHNFKIPEFIEKRASLSIKRNQKYRNSDEYVKFFTEKYINQRSLSLINTYMQDDELYYHLSCPNCGNIFDWSIKDRIEGRHQYPYCEKCNLNGKSKEEETVYDFVKSIYNGPILRNDRKALGDRKEIDIYLPEKKFGIEYNGLYWHSGDRQSHRHKWDLAQAAGIDLMQIWSSEWETKRPVLESIIMNRLGLATPLYARKCEVKEVPVKEARKFADENHMQGFYQGIYIGLYYNNDLVDMSIFCQCRFGGPYQWELTRHVIKHGYRIIGGLSKELAYFRRTGHHGDIVDYCDMRLFNGKGHWSFEEVGMTPPDMQYTDFVRIIPRGKYQKRNMSKILGFKFDPNKTQLENLHANNMDFIYGVGHKIFVQKENP